MKCDCKAFCVTRKGNNTDAKNNNNNEGMNAAFDRAKLWKKRMKKRNLCIINPNNKNADRETVAVEKKNLHENS